MYCVRVYDFGVYSQYYSKLIEVVLVVAFDAGWLGGCGSSWLGGRMGVCRAGWLVG